MSATFFPSINNRMDRSVPKFGARCTINRPVGCPLLDVVGPPWDGVAVATVAGARAFSNSNSPFPGTLTAIFRQHHERVSPPNPGRGQRAIGHIFPALHLYRA